MLLPIFFENVVIYGRKRAEFVLLVLCERGSLTAKSGENNADDSNNFFGSATSFSKPPLKPSFSCNFVTKADALLSIFYVIL